MEGCSVYYQSQSTASRYFSESPNEPDHWFEAPSPSDIPIDLPGGDEMILVVEDDRLVLRNTVRTLRARGYQVLAATGASEALEIFKEAKDSLHLVLTDVVMPGMNGKQLADDLRKQKPAISIIFMSGYAEDLIAQRGVIPAGIDFIEKPFTARTLLNRIRVVLNRPPKSS